MIKPRPPREGSDILSAAEACYYLGVSWNTLKRFLKEGLITYRKVGRRYFFTKKGLQDFVHGATLDRLSDIVYNADVNKVSRRLHEII